MGHSRNTQTKINDVNIFVISSKDENHFIEYPSITIKVGKTIATSDICQVTRMKEIHNNIYIELMSVNGVKVHTNIFTVEPTLLGMMVLLHRQQANLA